MLFRSDFSVLSQPNDSIAPNEQTTFQVKFKPNLNGIITDTVSFGCSDLDESRFYFSIKGSASVITEAENIQFEKETHIYPNPVSGILIIALDNNEIDNVRIVDLAGRILGEYTQKEIDFSSFNNGEYFIQLRTKNQEIHYFKVIKIE